MWILWNCEECDSYSVIVGSGNASMLSGQRAITWAIMANNYDIILMPLGHNVLIVPIFFRTRIY